MAEVREKLIVSTDWLAEKLEEKPRKNFVLLHCSWEPDADDYKAVHIPGAVCFSGLICRDANSAYLNMLPNPEEFAQYVTKLGVSNTDHVVVYDANVDTPAIQAACRAWNMFRIFGHENCSILDGGMKKWLNEGRQTAGAKALNKAPFVSKYRPELVADFETVLENINSKEPQQLADARPKSAYVGEKPYRGVLPGGHIKSALNVPCSETLDKSTGVFKSAEELEKMFKIHDIDINKPIIASCGTGMTACATVFAAKLLGKDDVPLYDGSYFEFVQRAPDSVKPGEEPS